MLEVNAVDLNTALTWTSIAFAALAALLWLRSASVKVKATPKGTRSKWGVGIIDDFGTDWIATAATQSRWSASAAIAAAASAGCQAWATYLVALQS